MSLFIPTESPDNISFFIRILNDLAALGDIGKHGTRFCFWYMGPCDLERTTCSRYHALLS